MKSIVIISIIGLSAFFNSSIYTKQFTTLGGTQISMAQYQGKKILVVNIASESEYAPAQLPQLEQLYQQYKDSVMVIAFPTNDFNKEPRTEAELKLLFQNTYHTSFPIATLTGVKDSTGSTHAIYQWLQHKSENGDIDIQVKKDFQKYLIDKDGKIAGVFSAATNPLDSAVINAITQ